MVKDYVYSKLYPKSGSLMLLLFLGKVLPCVICITDVGYRPFLSCTVVLKVLYVCIAQVKDHTYQHAVSVNQTLHKFAFTIQWPYDTTVQYMYALLSVEFVRVESICEYTVEH